MTETGNLRSAKRSWQFLSPITGHAEEFATGIPRGLPNEPKALLGFILRVLDGKHRRMIREHLDHFYSDSRFRAATDDEYMSRLRKYPDLLNFAVDAMIAAMREMADMWIDSGKSAAARDFDNPAHRNVEDVLPGRDSSLFLTIYRWLLRNDQSRYLLQMRRDGSSEIWPIYPIFPDPNGRGISDALEAYGKKWAAFHFSRLLNSQYSRLISRCDHCKGYFASQRVRRHEVKHGVFCPACKGKGSANRTVSSREKRLDTAAKAWIESESMPRKRRESPEDWEHRRREWIAAKVNEAHGQAFGRRWVSQHLSEIQERTEALRNAQS